MPQHNERLLSTVHKLRAQLESASDLDPRVADDLRATLAEIETALADQSPSSGALRAQLLKWRLGSVATEFEASHPTLAGAVGSVIDALAGMGI